MVVSGVQILSLRLGGNAQISVFDDLYQDSSRSVTACHPILQGCSGRRSWASLAEKQALAEAISQLRSTR